MTTVAVKRKLRLVLSIDGDGHAHNAWFKVVRIHRTWRAARVTAVAHRKMGALARVVRFQGYYLVAVRRPRKIRPASWQLVP